MKVDKWGWILWLVCCVLTDSGGAAYAAQPKDTLIKSHSDSFSELIARCAPDVHPATLTGVVETESTFNPFAIGVVGATMARSPQSLKEAIATAKSLDKQGYNFSLGLTQVNRFNLAYLGETYDTIFEPCHNIKAGAQILKDCYSRARVSSTIETKQQALRAALSCYYSGNFTRGFKPDRKGERSYVQKVVDHVLSKKIGKADKVVVPAVAQQESEADVDRRPAKMESPLSEGASFSARPAWGKFGDDPLPDGQQLGADNAAEHGTKSSLDRGIINNEISTTKNTPSNNLPPVTVKRRAGGSAWQNSGWTPYLWE